MINDLLKTNTNHSFNWFTDHTRYQVLSEFADKMINKTETKDIKDNITDAMPFGIIKYWFMTRWPFLLYGLLELRSNPSQT